MKKIIDEKGRLFGKLNLIDLLVVLLVIALVAAVGMKALNKEEVTEEPDLLEGYEMQPISYVVICRMVHNDIADNIETTEVGKQLMAGGEMVDSCYIDKIERGTFYETYVTPEGEPKKLASEEYCDLTFYISGEAPYGNNSYLVGTQEVRLGKSHIVKTVNFELTGAVMELEGING